MKKRILILDDKETIAKVLSIYLMAEYDCIWLQDGVQGMKWLQEGNSAGLNNFRHTHAGNERRRFSGMD